MFQARGVALLVLAGAVVVAPQLRASDIVLFTDTAGVASETLPGYYVQFGCGTDCVTGLEGYPYTVGTDAVPGTIYIGDPNGDVADTLVTTMPLTGGCTIGGVTKTPLECTAYITETEFAFTSGLDDGPLTTCASVGGCVPYDGTVQDLGVITWANGLFDADGTTTTVEFQFVAPEPGTFALLGLGFAGLLGMYRKARP